MTHDDRTLAVIAGVTILAGPRRTRPLAGFAYGLFLSRAQGAGLRRIERVVHDVFEQRKSVTARVDMLSVSHEILDGRVAAGALLRRTENGQLKAEVADLRERVEALERTRLRVVDGGQA